MRVIVTRPEPECSQWVRAMVAHGLDATAMPLIILCSANDAATVHGYWRRLTQYRAVMFVSGAAVQHFFSRCPAQEAPPIGGCVDSPRFWATGPGTISSLVRQGVDPAHIDAPDVDKGQFDSEALWAVVQAQAQRGQRVLIVRGADAAGLAMAHGAGRDWLATQLEQSGVGVDFVVVYQRCPPSWSDPERRHAQAAARDGSLWLFTSSQAIAHLSVCLPGQVWAGARAIATHARIAQAAREAGFGVVWESRPRMGDVVASIESAG